MIIFVELNTKNLHRPNRNRKRYIHLSDLLSIPIYELKLVQYGETNKNLNF